MKFYLAMTYRNGGIDVAKKLAPELEKLTGDQCTSRWHHSEAHEHYEFRKTIACTDVADIARSDYVIVAPLTETSRGSHVEIGLALGLDKPVYLYRPDGMDGTGFDTLCNDWKPEWIRALKDILEDKKLCQKCGKSLLLIETQHEDEFEKPFPCQDKTSECPDCCKLRDETWQKWWDEAHKDLESKAVSPHWAYFDCEPQLWVKLSDILKCFGDDQKCVKE